MADTKARYLAMLEKVAAWTPPTPEHAELKKFMADDLKEGIKHDCREISLLERRDPREWHARRIESAKRSVEQARNLDKQARERASQQTAWVSALRESLKEPAK